MPQKYETVREKGTGPDPISEKEGEDWGREKEKGREVVGVGRVLLLRKRRTCGPGNTAAQGSLPGTGGSTPNYGGGERPRLEKTVKKKCAAIGKTPLKNAGKEQHKERGGCSKKSTEP